jgi:hypothetical protein
MKRKLLNLLVLSVITSGLVYAQYIEDTLTVNRTMEPPFIDGYMEEWEWGTEAFDTITWYGTDENDIPHAPERSDFFAMYKTLWDGDYLYFLGVIEDDFVADKASLEDAGAPTWETDSWEFYIAPTLSKLPSMEEMTQIRWSYANVNSDDATSGVVNGWSSGGYMLDDFANAKRELSVDGWVLEVQIDLAPLAAKVDDIDTYSEGDIIGWNITVSDSDGEALRDWIGNWIPDTQWDQADTLGILKLGSDLTGTVGMEEALEAGSSSIYPNPVSEDLHIFCDTELETIEVYNPLGAMVMRERSVNKTINVSDLSTGIYFAKVYTSNGRVDTHKFIKK